MKKITKIEYQKRNKERFNIYLDEEYAFAISMDILIKFSLKKDMPLSNEQIEEILKDEEKISVYNYGISVLSRSAKSEYELRTKMQSKGFDFQLIDNAINTLREQKYLDDEKYCEMFINDKINIYKHGLRKIKEALYYKGIDKKIIEEKLSKISSEEELERAIFLGEKKLISIQEKDKKNMRLFNYLTGRGFEYETVIKAINKLLNTDIYNC